MKLKLTLFVALTMFFAACGDYEIVQKEDKSKDIKTETTDEEKNDAAKIDIEGNDGEKIEIKEDGVKVRDGDKEVSISKERISVKSDDDKSEIDSEDGKGKLAEKLTLKGINETKTYPCEGRRIMVNGTGNNYTFTGECSALLVNGTGQKVVVEKVSRINVNGTGNRVIYGGGPDGNEPKISKAGTGNSVSQKE